jgi:RNA polymerase sigma factor (sigma-70 family)
MVLYKKQIEKYKNSGRKEQFKLYKNYSKAMFNTSFRILKSHREAEEVLQNAFIETFRQLSSFQLERSFGKCLKRIVIDKSIQVLKERKTGISFNEKISYQDVQDIFQDQKMEKFEVCQINKAIYQLPDSYRIIFSLYIFEGYNHSEIAKILNISSSASKCMYSKAKKEINAYINESCSSLETKIQNV